MREVADAAGVSTMTVSNTLTGLRQVRPETQKKVMAAIETLGYRVNVAARNLRMGQTGTIGLALPLMDSHYFGMHAGMLAQRFALEGLTVVVEQTGMGRPGDISSLRGSRRNAYDGMILSSLGLPGHEVEALSRDVPLVVIGERPHGVDVDHVDMPNAEAAEAATRLLLERGCTRLVAVGTPAPDTHARQDTPEDAFTLRAQGFYNALAGSAGAVGRAITCGWSMSDGLQIAHQLAESGEVDGIFCMTDTLALGVLRGLADRGVRVPDDVLLVGFDDIPDAAFSVPSLTTVAPGHEDVVGAAVRLLLRRMGDPDAPPEAVISSFRLIERETTGLQLPRGLM